MAGGTLRIETASLPVSVSLTEASTGSTTTLYSDAAFTAPVAQPVVVVAGAPQVLYVLNPSTYTLSVKANGVEIADTKARTTRTINFHEGEGIGLRYDPTIDGVTDPTALSTAGLASREKVRRIVGSTVQTALQAGHTWSVTGTPVNLALNNTTDFILGSQSVTFDTNGAGAYTVPQGPSPESVAINSTGKAFRVWVKVSDPTQVGEFTFWAGSGGSFANTYFWDLLLYTGSAPNYLIAGQWSPLTFHIGTANVTGTPDRTALNRLKFQIKDRSGGAISVGINGFELIPDSSAIYPNGVVSISFDDSYASQFTSARAVMDKYGYAGTAYVITGNIGTGGRLSLAQATTLQDDHGWDIASHGSSQAAHDAGWQTLTTAARVAEAQAAKSWLLQNGFRAADHFAYPGGHYESGVYADVKPYFASARTIMSQNAETWPPGDPLRVRSMQPSASTSLASVQTQVDLTFNGKGWLPLSFHDFVTSGPTGVQWTQANFDSLCAYILSKGMAVRTVSQVLRGE